MDCVVLYKKYHRNYVKQFKKGVRVVVGCLEYVVEFSPSVNMLRLSPDPTFPEILAITAGLSIIPVRDGCCCTKVLVSSNGKINSLCHVIQEIS